MPKSSRANLTRQITFMAMMAALGSVLMFFPHFPVFPAAPFYKLDFAEIPVLIAGFACGPLAVIPVALVKNIAHLLLAADGTPIGEVSNFLQGTCFCMAACLVYKFWHKFAGAVVGLVVGIILTSLVAAPLTNYFIMFPAFGLNDMQERLAILPYTIAFNAIKTTIAAVVTVVLYKHISRLLRAFERTKPAQ